jgi:hypothetical protein
LERIQGLTFQELFLSESLTVEGFKKLLLALKTLHDIGNNKSVDIYGNYGKKLTERYKSHDYSKYDGSEKIHAKLQTKLKEYEDGDFGKVGIIHGDPVFSNILIDKFGKIKLIDPRGVLGNSNSIYGDVFYDYAKVYQSLIGYDEVMQNKSVSNEYRESLIDCLFAFIKKEYGEDRVEHIKVIANSLLFTLIPLHDNDKCNGYFNLIKMEDV